MFQKNEVLSQEWVRAQLIGASYSSVREVESELQTLTRHPLEIEVTIDALSTLFNTGITNPNIKAKPCSNIMPYSKA